jgi:hypothetical protein
MFYKLVPNRDKDHIAKSDPDIKILFSRRYRKALVSELLTLSPTVTEAHVSPINSTASLLLSCRFHVVVGAIQAAQGEKMFGLTFG